MKRQLGFDGEKIISIPEKLWTSIFSNYIGLFQLYITHIGYFPKATEHYRNRKSGCADNILLYCTQGKGYFIVDKEKRSVQANQFVIIPATAKPLEYGADEQDPWTIYWVHFKADKLPDFNRSLLSFDAFAVRDIPYHEEIPSIWSRMYDALDRGFSTANLCSASFNLYHLLSLLIFQQQNNSKQIATNLDPIEETVLYMKSTLDHTHKVSDLAQRHFLSTAYFATLFRKKTGMPPLAYFIHLKMQKACQELIQSEIQIKQIAHNLGYEDPFFFSRVFKKCMGISPLQYRTNTKSKSKRSA